MPIFIDSYISVLTIVNTSYQCSTAIILNSLVPCFERIILLLGVI